MGGAKEETAGAAEGGPRVALASVAELAGTPWPERQVGPQHLSWLVRWYPPPR